MVNAVMLVRDRLELTRQAIFTMLDHVPVGSLNLTIADDGSQDETRFLLERFANDRVRVLRLFPPVGIVGLARNLGILASERLFGRGDYLYLADLNGLNRTSNFSVVTLIRIMASTNGRQHRHQESVCMTRFRDSLN